MLLNGLLLVLLWLPTKKSINACMYVCMYVCMHVCMHVTYCECMLSLYACKYVRIINLYYKSKSVYVVLPFVCLYVCMFVCL